MSTAVKLINKSTKTLRPEKECEVLRALVAEKEREICLLREKIDILTQEVEKSQQALETRKLVEKAKGIMMTVGKMTEEEAYKTLQRKSMDSGKSMKDIAEAIIIALGPR